MSRARDPRPKNSRMLFDERGKFIGYLVLYPADGGRRRAWLATPSGQRSMPFVDEMRGATLVRRRPSKAHAARVRAADRLKAAAVEQVQA